MLKQPIKIILGIHPKLIRNAFCIVLNNYRSFQIVAAVGNGKDLIDKYFEMNADVIVTNIILPGINGIEAVQEIRERKADSCSLVVSEFTNGGLIEVCYNAGASGYISASEETSKLIDAIEIIHSGEFYYPYYFPDMRKPCDKKNVYGFECKYIKSILTNREREIFQLFGKGYTTCEISDMLFVSKKTVEYHEYHIRDKMNVKSFNQLISIATIHNLLYEKLV